MQRLLEPSGHVNNVLAGGILHHKEHVIARRAYCEVDGGPWLHVPKVHGLVCEQGNSTKIAILFAHKQTEVTYRNNPANDLCCEMRTGCLWHG